ncbi:hypothetical protein [Marinifilum breve]|nr:hypothetical protein [Marinifilum breve]
MKLVLTNADRGVKRKYHNNLLLISYGRPIENNNVGFKFIHLLFFPKAMT